MQASLRYALLKLLKCLTDDEAAATETSTQQTNAKIVEAQLKTQNLCNKPFIVVVCACTGLLGSCVVGVDVERNVTHSLNVDQDLRVITYW